MDICFVLSRVKFPTSMNSETQGVAVVFRIRFKKILVYSVHAMFATRGIHFPATDQNSGDNRLRFSFFVFTNEQIYSRQFPGRNGRIILRLQATVAGMKFKSRIHGIYSCDKIVEDKQFCKKIKR
ncbi:hypothetical protein CDAR_366831 [Caerostris darwini]|uniref:Uncharacterized protein n=1 Tax=Caerostris darwini TaxID=1538125 RepID=A0AAV4NAB4_9ARAC|nr:hypothetical protein CDAR_366831 [Caerostris darwini]